MAYKIDRGVRIKVGDIEPNPWNPNKTNSSQQQAIAESIDRYGQIAELLVRPHPEKPGLYQVIDGEHRLSELTKLDEFAFTNVIYGLSEVEAKKLTIIMNETRGEADKIELAQLLADINDELGEGTRVGLPYSESELDELIRLASVDWDNFASDEVNLQSEPEPHVEDKDWTVLTVKVSNDVFEKIKDAYNLVEQEKGKMSSDKAVAWGQVLECLALDYVARQ